MNDWCETPCAHVACAHARQYGRLYVGPDRRTFSRRAGDATGYRPLADLGQESNSLADVLVEWATQGDKEN